MRARTDSRYVLSAMAMTRPNMARKLSRSDGGGGEGRRQAPTPQTSDEVGGSEHHSEALASPSVARTLRTVPSPRSTKRPLAIERSSAASRPVKIAPPRWSLAKASPVFEAAQ